MKNLHALAAAINAQLNTRAGLTVVLSYSVSSGYAELHRIATVQRGQGIARAAMAEPCAWADTHGVPLALTTSADWGANRARLRTFYASFGFVVNRGQHKDFTTRAEMIRPQRHMS